MPAITDFATPAAAVTAGYAKTQTDRGVPPVTPNFNKSQPLRYLTVFDKPTTGAQNSGSRLHGVGESSVSAAAADTQALLSLNANRRSYYGGSSGRASGDVDSPTARGASHTVDVS